jgi:hypothetical protein
MSAAELCRVELVAEIRSSHAHPLQTYRVTNADGSICDLVVAHNGLRKTAWCVQHAKWDDCEGTARLHCSIDFATAGECAGK